MASSARRKTTCSKCNKAAGIFTCRGCEKDFCYRHVAEHRQELNKHMEELTNNHDLFVQTIAEQEANPNCHPSIGKINTWEQKSIEKIHQAAKGAREELLKNLGDHRAQVANNLQQITEELNKARSEDDYVETDLNEWKEKLEKLRTDLAATQMLDLSQDEDARTLIPKIFVRKISTDIFNQTLKDIQILEDGKLAVHGQTQQHAMVRGKNEYSSGQHRLYFQLECYQNIGNIFCGVVSKTMSVETIQNILKELDSYEQKYGSRRFSNRHSTNLTVSDRIKHASGLNCNDGYYNPASTDSKFIPVCLTARAVMCKKNKVELLIDCDAKTICLTNEETQQKQDCAVELNTCPLPWQICCIAYSANDRIRISEINSVDNE
ncbi:unnamed protein product [Adineta ricciae]|uniref:Uncharacterized protein n=1 Tax=Adineta ricciae TaxID=249248 RepID=A0A814K1N4_ADIRI|nr:unnamed protein product [Adineta ricciae]